jgi:hypothetical protein
MRRLSRAPPFPASRGDMTTLGPACDNVAMHYLEFPPDQMIVKVKGGDRVPMSYQEFLDEHVWIDNKWRTDGEFARARNRLMQLFDKAFSKKARGVGIADKDFEKFEPIAALRGPDFRVPPENIRPVSVFTDAAMFATTVEPDWYDGPKEDDEKAKAPAKPAKAGSAKA